MRIYKFWKHCSVAYLTNIYATNINCKPLMALKCLLKVLDESFYNKCKSSVTLLLVSGYIMGLCKLEKCYLLYL